MKVSAIFAFLICCLMASCSKNSQGSDAKVDIDKSSHALIAEAVSKVSPEVKEKFEQLFDEWNTTYNTERQTQLSSRYVYPNELPQYDTLVAMGEDIIPLVVEKMNGADYYFSRLVYEGIRPADKLTDTDILGRERAQEYVTMWANNVNS